MDYAVVTSLLGIVEQQLVQKPQHNNPCFILPPHTQIILSTLKDKLLFLQAYLHQSHQLSVYLAESEEELSLLHKEIRDVAGKAEDEIESKLGEVYLQGEAACEDLHHTLQQVVKDIECVEVRIRNHLHQITLHTDDDACLQLEKVRDGGSSSSKYDLEHGENIMMIGVEDDVEKIKGMLLIQSSSSSTQQLKVVSIVGMGGTGKTTLAKTVYKDPSIVSHFDIQAWTVASQQYSMRKLLIGILGCIVPSSLTNEEISKKNDDQLADQLRKILMGQRYLIVIDNLWTTKAWNEFRTCFPEVSNNGSRVLITTRIMEVAEFVSSGMCIYKTRFLNLEESWSLLSKTVFNGKHYCLPPQIESIGRCIVEKCGGMPLLIILIGGLLATLNNSIKQWEDIGKELNNSPFQGLYNHFLYTTEVCYKYLPTHLKPCFLYLGAFPEDTEIHVEKLIKLWVAEGFLKPEMNKSFEEIGFDYLCDLINRRLVQVHKRSLNGKIKSCMLHDLVHECFLEKAHEEGITIISEGGYYKPHKGCRWVNHHLSINSNYFHYASHQTRSLLYFGERLYLSKCWFIFPSLELVRVLDLSLLKYWHGIPNEIVDLIHLRYLALTTIGSLYNFQLFKLQSLQTLILSSWTKECQLQLPCDFLDLPWLRHVRIDNGSLFYLPNLVQENLQTLSWFKVAGWDSRTTDFTKVPNLKELGIYIEGEVLPNALDSLAQLHQLEKLKVKMGMVERFNLPNSFPSNLKQLTLSNTYLSWEDMDIIGKLPNLDLLKLKDFAFCGLEWKPRDGEFLQLRFFLIECSDLERWNANSSHFPVLERLILRYC